MSSTFSPAELRRKGMEILVRELGYADAVRFIQQFNLGRGDYTRERHTLLPEVTVDELIAEADRIVQEQRRSA